MGVDGWNKPECITGLKILYYMYTMFSVIFKSWI